MCLVMLLLLPWLAYALALGEALPHVRLADGMGKLTLAEQERAITILQEQLR